MCVGFAQTQLPQQKAVTTVGRLPKMAAHVVLVQNQRERAAAMRGKALVFSALLLALDICATNAQSLFEDKIKCQRLAKENIGIDSYNIVQNRTTKITSNYDAKNANCYALQISEVIHSNPYQLSIQKILYDVITKRQIAVTQILEYENKSYNYEYGTVYDTNMKFSYADVENYISDKMKTER